MKNKKDKAVANDNGQRKGKNLEAMAEWYALPPKFRHPNTETELAAKLGMSPEEFQTLKGHEFLPLFHLQHLEEYMTDRLRKIIAYAGPAVILCGDTKETKLLVEMAGRILLEEWTS